MRDIERQFAHLSARRHAPVSPCSHWTEAGSAAADDAFFDRPAAQPRGARSSPLQVAPAFEPPRLDKPIEAARAAAAPPVRDALLQCLVWLTRHHGKARSAESLRAGQPWTGR